MNWLLRLRTHTVFNKIDAEGMHLNEIIAIYFHRTAATVYFIYALWGMVSFIGYIPTLAHVAGPGFQDFFSLMVIPLALASTAGAVFFPRTARLELFAASALAILVAIYLTIMFIQGLQGDIIRLTNFFLNVEHLVLPIARVALIIRSLLAEAKKRRSPNGLD